MPRKYQWSLVTRSNTVIVTEPRKFRFLAEVEAWRRNRAKTVSVEEAPRRAKRG